jgi:hypothetical protein
MSWAHSRVRRRGSCVRRRSVRRGQSAAALDRRAPEFSVPRDQYDIAVEHERAGEMDRVVAPECVVVSELPGVVGEGFVDPDDQQLAMQRPERFARSRVPPCTQTSGAACRCKRRSTLGVGHDARCPRERSGPEVRDQLRAVLDDHELDERGGVEVEDQRRCSATRSETVPRAFTSARRALRGRDGRVMSPRCSSCANGSSWSTADSRAIGLPRRVTTTCAPRSTRSRCSLRRS